MWTDSPVPELREATQFNLADVEEFDEFGDFLYQIDFLRMFNLHDLDSQAINKCLDDEVALWNSDGNFEEWKLCLQWVAVTHWAGRTLNAEDSSSAECKSAFLVLLCYDYLFVTAKVLKMLAAKRDQGDSVEGVVEGVLLPCLQRLQSAREPDKVGADAESCA